MKVKYIVNARSNAKSGGKWSRASLEIGLAYRLGLGPNSEFRALFAGVHRAKHETEAGRSRGRYTIFLMKKRNTHDGLRRRTSIVLVPTRLTLSYEMKGSVVRIATPPCALVSRGARWLEEETPVHVVAWNSLFSKPQPPLYAVSWLPRLSESLLSFSGHTCGFRAYRAIVVNDGWRIAQDVLF